MLGGASAGGEERHGGTLKLGQSTSPEGGYPFSAAVLRKPLKKARKLFSKRNPRTHRTGPPTLLKRRETGAYKGDVFRRGAPKGKVRGREGRGKTPPPIECRISSIDGERSSRKGDSRFSLKQTCPLVIPHGKFL